eukprot:scaffold4434_cov109-Isochrysis_galbana.AAC.9
MRDAGITVQWLEQRLLVRWGRETLRIGVGGGGRAEQANVISLSPLCCSSGAMGIEPLGGRTTRQPEGDRPFPHVLWGCRCSMPLR